MILKIKGPSYLHFLIYFALIFLSSLLFFAFCKLIIWLSTKVKNAIIKRNDDERKMKQQMTFEQQNNEGNGERTNSQPTNEEKGSQFIKDEQNQRNRMLEALADVVNGDNVQMTDTSILTMNEVCSYQMKFQ